MPHFMAAMPGKQSYVWKHINIQFLSLYSAVSPQFNGFHLKLRNKIQRVKSKIKIGAKLVLKWKLGEDEGQYYTY